MTQRFGWPVFGGSGKLDLRPKFTRGPSIDPAISFEGDFLTIDPGAGPGLTWSLTLNGTDITPEVDAGQWESRAGVVLLASRVSDANGTRTAGASALVLAVIVPPPDPEPEPQAIFTADSDGITVTGSASPLNNISGTFVTDDDGLIFVGA